MSGKLLLLLLVVLGLAIAKAEKEKQGTKLKQSDEDGDDDDATGMGTHDHKMHHEKEDDHKHDDHHGGRKVKSHSHKKHHERKDGHDVQGPHDHDIHHPKPQEASAKSDGECDCAKSILPHLKHHFQEHHKEKGKKHKHKLHHDGKDDDSHDHDDHHGKAHHPQMHEGDNMKKFLRRTLMKMAEKPHINKDTKRYKSCAEYARSTSILKSGYYLLTIGNDPCVVFCDFHSEPGTAYTLVMSYWYHALMIMPKPSPFKRPLADNAPVNDHQPNWLAYRMSLTHMKALLAVSDLVRFTCSPQGTYRGHQFVDYLRFAKSSFDLFTTHPAPKGGECAKVEYINVSNKFACANCKVPFFHPEKTMFHVHPSGKGYDCSISVPKGRYFGDYVEFKDRVPEFLCTRGHHSSTQLWFGSRI